MMSGPRWRRWGRPRLLLALAVTAAAPVAMAAVTQRPGDLRLYPAAPPGVTIYVTYNDFHSDLNVPASFLAEGRGPSAVAAAQLRPRRWIALGWGDAVFYQGQGFSPARVVALLHSAFWPRNASVVHLAGDDDPLRPAPGWHALSLTLSTQGAEALRRRLDDSFVLEEGRPVPAVAPASGEARPDARFFKSRENAWALHVCNHWTAELLNAAGVPVTPALDLSAVGLAADLRWRAHAAPPSRAEERGAGLNTAPDDPLRGRAASGERPTRHGV